MIPTALMASAIAESELCSQDLENRLNKIEEFSRGDC